MSALEKIQKRMDAGETIWLDAGNGTELQDRGVNMHPKVWCGVAHVEQPQTMIDIHADYIKVGADIITTNTFSSNRNMLGPSGLGDQVADTIQTGVRLAQQARASCNADDRVAIAGSMSHQVPIIPGTTTRNPETIPDNETAAQNFTEMAGLLANSGVDLILLEMMSDPALVKLAKKAATQTGLPVWMGMCCKRAESGELVNYVHTDMSFEDTCKQLIDDSIQVVGIMHTNIDYIDDAIETIRNHWSGPVMVYPDSGHFTMPDWHFESVISPDAYAAHTKRWADEGVQILGACCGMGVNHLEACVRKLG